MPQRERQEKRVILPAEGWWAVSKPIGLEGGEAWWEKIIAWRIAEDGYEVEAVTAPDSGGDASPLSLEYGGWLAFCYAPDRRAEGVGEWPNDCVHARHGR